MLLMASEVLLWSFDNCLQTTQTEMLTLVPNPFLADCSWKHIFALIQENKSPAVQLDKWTSDVPSL